MRSEGPWASGHHFADQFHWHIMAAVLVLAATVRADAAEPKRVMLLYSLGRDFKPWSEYVLSDGHVAGFGTPTKLSNLRFDAILLLLPAKFMSRVR